MVLGLTSNISYFEDPKRFLFSLSRYKFAAKMLNGTDRCLEIGCGDGFYSHIVKQEVGRLVAVDFDPLFIEEAKNQYGCKFDIDFQVWNPLEGPLQLGGPFDGVFLLDVLEHVRPDDEFKFLNAICHQLTRKATCVLGMPSLASQEHASPRSQVGHVNCKSAEDLRNTLRGFFDYVYLFSMNDEVVHTGFTDMAHYYLAVCANPHASGRVVSSI